MSATNRLFIAVALKRGEIITLSNIAPSVIHKLPMYSFDLLYVYFRPLHRIMLSTNSTESLIDGLQVYHKGNVDTDYFTLRN